MAAGYKRKAYYFCLLCLCCLLATAFYVGVAKQKETPEKEYTDVEREAFIADALLNVKNSPVKRNVFPTYDVSRLADWSPREKAVFKFPRAVAIGFKKNYRTQSEYPQLLRKGIEPHKKVNQGFDTSVWGNAVSALIFKLKSIFGLHREGAYEIFYEPLEKELKAFLPQLKEAVGFDVRLVDVAEAAAPEGKNNNVRIYIISDYGPTSWIDGKPVFNGYDNVLIHDDPRHRSDVIGFNILSPFLMGYAYFDETQNITHVVCQMWTYMKPAERRETMRECIVRGLGVVGKIDGREHFQTPKLPDILKKTLSFLYCDEVKSGMEKEALLKVLREGRCLPKHKK